MIIQCGACGKLRNLPHDGTPEEIEQTIADTIEEGWRYASSYDGYICPSCRAHNPDKLYEMYVGKPKASSKSNSYKILLRQMAQFILALRRDY